MNSLFKNIKYLNLTCNLHIYKTFHNAPLFDLIQRTTGEAVSESFINKLKRTSPNFDSISNDRLQCSLQILSKFGITEIEACMDPHILCMNPITIDNYGEILKECGFIQIQAKHIIRYHTIVKSKTISYLKKKSLITNDLNIEQSLHNLLHDWPARHKLIKNFPDSITSLLTIRLHVLEDYLKWRLNITSEDFQKYITNYRPFKHKPMSDIQESVNIAEHHLNLNLETIRRNGFIISSDPINTKLILDNVDSLAGLDVREAIKMEPGILKNNYDSLVKIREIMEQYRISEEAQRKCLRIFCMCPKSVEERLEELRSSKHYQVLSTHPRVLWMVVHKKKMMTRIAKIEDAKKQCFSLNHLVASSHVFNSYINSFGDKVCGRDLAILISSSLNINMPDPEVKKLILQRLRKHKYWLHATLAVVDANLKLLKQRVDDDVILQNCQLLLYPVNEITQYMDYLLSLRDNKSAHHSPSLDGNYNSLKHELLTDKQILSLVLYEIEKKYHFSGDGIWAKQDGVKLDQVVS